MAALKRRVILYFFVVHFKMSAILFYSSFISLQFFIFFLIIFYYYICIINFRMIFSRNKKKFHNFFNVTAACIKYILEYESNLLDFIVIDIYRQYY